MPEGPSSRCRLAPPLAAHLGATGAIRSRITNSWFRRTSRTWPGARSWTSAQQLASGNFAAHSRQTARCPNWAASRSALLTRQVSAHPWTWPHDTCHPWEDISPLGGRAPPTTDIQRSLRCAQDCEECHKKESSLRSPNSRFSSQGRIVARRSPPDNRRIIFNAQRNSIASTSYKTILSARTTTAARKMRRNHTLLMR